VATQETVNDSNERLRAIESELDEQRALLEAIAEEHDVDPEAAETDATAEQT
jgi:hypothetical protein